MSILSIFSKKSTLTLSTFLLCYRHCFALTSLASLTSSSASVVVGRRSASRSTTSTKILGFATSSSPNNTQNRFKFTPSDCRPRSVSAACSSSLTSSWAPSSTSSSALHFQNNNNNCYHAPSAFIMPPRRSSRAASAAANAKISKGAEDQEDPAQVEKEQEQEGEAKSKASPTKKKTVLKGTAEKLNDDNSKDDEDNNETKKGSNGKKVKKSKAKASPKKRKAKSSASDNEDEDEDDDDEVGEEDSDGDDIASDSKPKPKTKAKTKTKSKASTTPKKRKSKASNSDNDEDDNESSPKKRASPKKKTTAATTTSSSNASTTTTTTTTTSTSFTTAKSSTTSTTKGSTPAKKKSKTDHQRWTERTPLTKLHNPQLATQTHGSYTFTILSWNVAGLRALVKNHPTALPDLATKHQADVICLQETKLQEGHLEDKKLKLKENLLDKMEEVGYDYYFCYSLEKKGYSGTAMFIKKRGGGGCAEAAAVKEGHNNKDDTSKKGKKQATLGSFFGSAKKKSDKVDGDAANNNNNGIDNGNDKPTGDISETTLQPIQIINELNLPTHDGEGRVITAEFPLFYLTNVYVPNSGQKLDRLSYRTDQWDVDFVAKMQEYEQSKPIIWLGDLNVAFDEKDTWNEGAKHLVKSAGTTPQERESFERQLGRGFVDAFRYLHAEGRGHYSYWSQRAGNRAPNQGLRLDYFICSKSLMQDGEDKKAVVRDSYMVPDQLGSDHCPIVLEIEIKK